MSPRKSARVSARVSTLGDNPKTCKSSSSKAGKSVNAKKVCSRSCSSSKSQKKGQQKPMESVSRLKKEVTHHFLVLYVKLETSDNY